MNDKPKDNNQNTQTTALTPVPAPKPRVKGSHRGKKPPVLKWL